MVDINALLQKIDENSGQKSPLLPIKEEVDLELEKITKPNRLDIILNLIQEKRSKDLQLLLTDEAHLVDSELLIINFFWENYFSSTIKEKLEHLIRPILQEFVVPKGITVEEYRRKVQEFAEENYLTYTMSLLKNVTIPPREEKKNPGFDFLKLLGQYTDKEIEEEDKREPITNTINEAFEKLGSYSIQNVESSTNIPNEKNEVNQELFQEAKRPSAKTLLKGYWFKPGSLESSKSAQKQTSLIVDIIQIITILHGKSLEEVRQYIHHHPEMKEQLSAEFINKIKKQDFEFLLIYQVVFKFLVRDNVGKMVINLVNELIDTLNTHNYLEIKLYLLSIIQEKLRFEENKRILASLRNLFKESIFYTNENPLKMILLAIETVIKIRKSRPQLSYLCSKQKEKLFLLAERIQNSIKSIEHLAEIYLDKDMKGRTVISIMNGLKDPQLFQDEKLLTLAQIIWVSKYEMTNDLSLLATMLQIPMERKNLFNYLGKSRVIEPQSYIFSYKIWRESPMARYFSKTFLEFIYIIIMSGVFIYTSHLLSQSDDSVLNYRSWIYASECFVCLQFFTFVQFALELRSHFKLQRNSSYKIQFTFYLEFLAAVDAIIATYIYITIDPASKHHKYNMNKKYSLYLGILIFLNCIHFFIKLKFSRTIGYLILSLEKMFIDLAKYIILFMLQLLCFTLLLSVAYSISPSYSDFNVSFQTLFYNALSLPDAGDIQNFIGYDWQERIFGQVITIIFLIVNIIIAINIAIAILSDSYVNAQDISDYMFIHEIIDIYGSYQASEYSSIASAYYPINIALYPLTLLLLILPKHKAVKLNEFILHIEFFMIFLIISGVLLICELVLLPFIYLYHIISILSECAGHSKEDKERKSAKRIIFEISIWILFGVFILIYYIGIDLKTLFQTIYLNPITCVIEYGTKTQISQDALQKALAIFKPIKQKFLTRDEFLNKFREVEEINKEAIIHQGEDERPISDIFLKGFIKMRSKSKGIDQNVIKVTTITSILEVYYAIHRFNMQDKQETASIYLNTKNVLNISTLYKKFGDI